MKSFGLSCLKIVAVILVSCLSYWRISSGIDSLTIGHFLIPLGIAAYVFLRIGYENGFKDGGLEGRHHFDKAQLAELMSMVDPKKFGEEQSKARWADRIEQTNDFWSELLAKRNCSKCDWSGYRFNLTTDTQGTRYGTKSVTYAKSNFTYPVTRTIPGQEGYGNEVGVACPECGTQIDGTHPDSDEVV